MLCLAGICSPQTTDGDSDTAAEPPTDSTGDSDADAATESESAAEGSKWRIETILTYAEAWRDFPCEDVIMQRLPDCYDVGELAKLRLKPTSGALSCES